MRSCVPTSCMLVFMCLCVCMCARACICMLAFVGCVVGMEVMRVSISALRTDGRVCLYKMLRALCTWNVRDRVRVDMHCPQCGFLIA